MIEASVVVCKCKKKHALYGVRFERMAGEWKYTWAFALKESTARSEGYDKMTIKGQISTTSEYPGCPYCGAMGFVICECGKLNCYTPGARKFTCEWCGETGTIVAYDGGGFSAYEDR